MTLLKKRILPPINPARIVKLAIAVCVLVTCRIWGADAPSSAVPPSKPVRLAVLAEDVAPESHVLADLLTVKLARCPGVETVERAEIERVLDEQKLNAEGLVEADSRIRLGKILGAQG